MPPSRKEIDIFEALRTMGERILRGEFGRGDNFEALAAKQEFEELVTDIVQETKELARDNFCVPIQAEIQAEGVEDAEETANDSEETTAIDTGPAEDAAETQVINTAGVGPVKDVLSESLDGS